MALKRREVSDSKCEVPGCEGRALVNEEGDVTDCCYEHSLQGSDTDCTMDNDGIIDWTAIDVAARGLRDVRLTWVEKDIVIATVLVRGGNITTALDRADAHHSCAHGGRRAVAVKAIMEALRG